MRDAIAELFTTERTDRAAVPPPDALLAPGENEMEIRPASKRRHQAVIWILLVLAALQCGRASFVVNVSYIDLPLYAAGAERMPYQGRVAMIPVLRWAGHNRLLAKAAAVVNRTQQATPQHASRPEVMSPEKLLCVLLGMLSVLVMTLGATWFTRRHMPRFWWLGGFLVLVILNASYASRAELNFWYPYDLPHFAVFGLATLCLLEGEWIAFFAFFLLDMPIRETSVYLALLGSAVAYQRKQPKLVGSVIAAALLVWLPLRLAITHQFGHNPSELGVRWIGVFHALADPLHWPQVASAGGFLFLPLWLGRRYLRADQRAFILAALPCMAVTLAFGMWYESRIFGEWTVALAILLSYEIGRWLSGRRGFGSAPGDLEFGH